MVYGNIKSVRAASRPAAVKKQKSVKKKKSKKHK